MRQNGCDMIDVVRGEGSSGAAFCCIILILFLILVLIPIVRSICEYAERIKIKNKIKIKNLNLDFWAPAGCADRENSLRSRAISLAKMRLGILPCRVLPKASSSINSPLTGLLRIYVDKQQTNLPAGFVWAEFEPKILAASEAALKEAEDRLNEKERLLLQLDLPKQQL